jgi:hypothetical protein
MNVPVAPGRRTNRTVDAVNVLVVSAGAGGACERSHDTEA